jgi:hypothetical protein
LIGKILNNDYTNKYFMTPLIHLDYPIDTTILLQSAATARLSSKPYTDSRYSDLKLDRWHIGHYSDKIIDKIMQDFEVDGKPRFYWLEPFAEIPEHVDNGTQCSINLILTQDPAPITINSIEFYYKQALLDTTVPHAVFNGPNERIMLKISIFDETYEQFKKRIKYKAKSNDD